MHFYFSLEWSDKYKISKSIVFDSIHFFYKILWEGCCILNYSILPHSVAGHFSNTTLLSVTLLSGKKKYWSTNIFMLKKIITKLQWASENREDYDENTPAVGQVPSVVWLHSWKRLILQKCGCSPQVITIYPPQLSEAELTQWQSISLTKANRSVNYGNLRTCSPSTPLKEN